MNESDDDIIDASEEFAPEPTNVISPFSPGSFFGDRFRIDEPLGVGAMGTVFRATDLTTNQHVALKVLLKERQDAEKRERFAREAEILSQLTHPGIVGIHGYGHAEGSVPWLAMELIEGETLGARIRRKGGLPAVELVPILSAICDTLESAHQAGVIHRDLKPDHIFLRHPSAGSIVKLIDFGLSSVASSKKLTRTGTVMGTPRYMAPELFASAKNASPASDVYALGVIMYEALCGQSPFVASDHGQLLGVILKGKVQSILVHRPELSETLDATLQRAMAKDPTRRFATPYAFADAFAVSIGLRSSMPPPPGLINELTGKEASLHSSWTSYFWLIMAGILSVVVGGMLGYLLLR